ncbi:MAG: hypothetical protein WDZ37_05520 [Solirubrobacterales bacterium]
MKARRPTRDARAEAFRQLVERGGGSLSLTRPNLLDLRERGLTAGQVDASIDALVEDGRATVAAERGCVEVKLNGERP